MPMSSLRCKLRADRGLFSHPSSEATTVTIAPVAGAFTVSGALTIPAGETASDGSVTLTAVDNATDAPATEVTLAATAANDLGATDPAGATLTITDDDPAPIVTLVLTPDGVDAPLHRAPTCAG